MSDSEDSDYTYKSKTTTVTLVIGKQYTTDKTDTSDSDGDSDHGKKTKAHHGRNTKAGHKNSNVKHVTLAAQKPPNHRDHETKSSHNNRNIKQNSHDETGRESKHDKENAKYQSNEDGKRNDRSSSPSRGKRTRKSKKCSMEAQHMRKRLVQLTGSDTIRANDKEYMDKLRTKIWEEYENELQRKEAERAENERQRMRKLMARGIIGPDEMREDRVLWGEYRRKSVMYEQKYRGKRRKKTSRTPRSETPDKLMRAKSAPQTRQDFKKVGSSSASSGEVRFRNEQQSGYDDRGDISRCRSKPSRPATSVGPRSRYSGTFRMESGTVTPSSSRQSMTSQSYDSRRSSAITINTDTDRDSNFNHSSSRPGSRPSKFEHPIIQQMRREETVSGLYHLAEVACPVELREKRTSKVKKEAVQEEEYAYNPNRKVIRKTP